MSFISESVGKIVESYSLVPFSEPPPHFVALCILIALVPPLISAWKAAGADLERLLNGSSKANTRATSFFLHAVVRATNPFHSLILDLSCYSGDSQLDVKRFSRHFLHSCLDITFMKRR